MQLIIIGCKNTRIVIKSNKNQMKKVVKMNNNDNT